MKSQIHLRNFNSMQKISLKTIKKVDDKKKKKLLRKLEEKERVKIRKTAQNNKNCLGK